MINEDVRHIIEPELAAGEELLWADRPRSFPINSTFLMGTIIGGVFSVIGVIAFLGTLISGAYIATAFMTLWSAMVMFFFWSYSKNLLGPSTQVFAVTNKRALIIERQGNMRVASLNKQVFNQIQRSGNNDIGSLQFGSANSIFLMGINMQIPLNTFHKIRNPREVEDLIRKTFRTKD